MEVLSFQAPLVFRHVRVGDGDVIVPGSRVLKADALERLEQRDTVMDHSQTDLSLHPFIDLRPSLSALGRLGDAFHVARPCRVHRVCPSMAAIVQVHES
ncbi:hypothetical protein DT23_15035 [Thioclava indica]|uniref:Uncharacterized protein n=1 Tax=Thioclava indica TaxID=1353528 RepID=A0A074JTY5_9RHOB|nr:hypothetical protein DT23_15035 [Thioclava indica]